ncbi:MAG: lysophospholipid acyltransferase family protein [Tepidisphaeraceae bacterium]
MSDLFYDTLVLLGRHPFWVSSRPTVLDAGVTRRNGAFILAANHASPYDIPILMRHCHRRIDFVSIREVFEKPFTRWLYGNMNAFPLDRSRADSPAVRTILDRLHRGRVIGMFPEGGFRLGKDSVLNSRRIRPGIGRLAKIANVPILPCAIVGSQNFGHALSWLPLRRTRYGVAFGEAILPDGDPADIETRLVDALVACHARLQASDQYDAFAGRT